MQDVLAGVKDINTFRLRERGSLSVIDKLHIKKGVSDIERRVEANYALINARAIFLLVDWLTDLS